VTSVTKEKLRSIQKKWNCKSVQVKFTIIDKNSFDRILSEVGAILADHMRLPNSNLKQEEIENVNEEKF
jgi:hypothetical protein